MGSSQSTAEETGNTENSTNKNEAGEGTKHNYANLLADEILCGLIAELQNILENSKTNNATEKIASEKRTNQIILLQQKFTEYRKVVEEVKDKELKSLTLEVLRLKNHVEECEKSINKSNKEKQDIEKRLLKESLEQQKIVGELNDKYRKTEKALNKECDLRKSLEKEVVQMKTLKKEIETQTRKIGELQRELDDSKVKLQGEIKLKQELETKLKLGEYKSTDETTKVLRDTISRQSAVVQKIQDSLRETQQHLNIQLQAIKEESRHLEIEKQLVRILKNEKERLINKLQTNEAEQEGARTKYEIKFEGQAKQIKDLTRKLSVVEKNHKVKLRKKTQAELLILEEKNKQITQLQAKVDEQDRMLIENSRSTVQKQEKLELEMDTELSKFLKKSEETIIKQLKMKDLEQEEVKVKYETKLKEQVEKLNRTWHKLRITQKKCDQQEQLKKETQGKLNLLEMSFKSMKNFCEKELRERKDFLEEFEKLRQKEKTESKDLAEAKTENNMDLLLKEKIDLEMRLDRQTNEIALLKQQMKQMEAQIQSMACEERSNSKREEMTKLHDEFVNILKKFNENE